MLRNWIDMIGSFLAAYFLAVVFAPMLGFTAALDFGYLIAGQPLWSLFCVFVVGPLCLFGLFLMTNKD